MFQVFPGLVGNVAALGGSVPLLDGTESDGTNKLSGGSLDFTSQWNVGGASLTANVATSPAGTTTAASLLEAATTARHIGYNQSYFSITAGASVVYSVYAKQVTRRYLQILIASSSKIYAYYDLQTGTVTNSGTVSPDGSTAVSSTSIQAAVNGFYKCTLTGIVDASTTTPYFQFCLSDVGTYGAPLDSDSPSYAGNTSNGAYLWRPKVV